MATRRATASDSAETPPRRGRPATTPQAREHELVNLAYELAEKQIMEGTASSQVVTHFLKLGSTREAVEQERLRGEVLLNQAKIEAIASASRSEELFQQAIQQMKGYAMEEPPDWDEYQNG